MRRRSISLPVVALALPLALTTTALAHHAMGGEIPDTALAGLLSGLAHPVIELPHLATVLLVGIAAARLGRPAWVTYFVTGSFIGTVAALQLGLSPSEALVLATPILLAGAALLRSPQGHVADAVALHAVGVVHGIAFAEAIVGAETTPVTAYLLGVAIAELAIAGMAAAATLSLLPAHEPSTGYPDRE